MSTIKINEINIPVFGKCLHLCNNFVELYVTLDFGPRIIHFSGLGKPNMMYQDTEKKTLGEKYDCFEGDHIILYGGHRLWISPEIVPRCYYPDNKPVSYNLIEGGAEFIAPIEVANNIQKIITIELHESAPSVTLNHTIKNCGNWDIELAPWCITMLDKGGKEVMPMPNRKTGYLCNRNFSYWDYSEMNDSRVYYGKDYMTLTQDESKPNPYKLGYNNEAGWAAYFNKGQVFIKYFEAQLNGFYPDNGCCFESYTNNVMLECESLGEITLLQPGEEITHVEEWELYAEDSVPENNDASIHDIVSKYIK